MQFRKSSSPAPEINLIPFIDVLLVIIIFLVLSTTYARFAGMQIQLPSTSTEAPASAPAKIAVFVDSAGNYGVGNAVLASSDLDGLRGALQGSLPARQNTKNTILVIYADAQTPHQSVLSIMDEARKINIARITFAAQNNKKP